MSDDKNKPPLDPGAENPDKKAAKPGKAKRVKEEKVNGLNLQEAESLEEGTVIGLGKLDANGGKTENYVWVEGTGESRHLAKGKKYEVNRAHAEKLISKNAAILTTTPLKPIAKPVKKKQADEEDDD